jgi:L-2-hydroxyglutarate oxidase LhgO
VVLCGVTDSQKLAGRMSVAAVDAVGEVIIQQQSFIEKFVQVTPPEVSKTLKEYITENNLQTSSNENFQKISEHANGLSSEHTSQGNSSY